MVSDKSPYTTNRMQYKHSNYEGEQDTDSLQAFHQSCKRGKPCGDGCAAEVTPCDEDEECTGSGVVKVKIPSEWR